MTVVEGIADIETVTGLMRVHTIRPALAQQRVPALLLFSEIFQITAPIRRLATLLAGHGFLVACPEVYHEYEPAGRVLAYDQAGSDRGNELKYLKPVTAFDSDTDALISHLLADPQCTGSIGSFGVCLGGHLAFRAALDPRVQAAVCFYATDLHSASLGRGGDDSLARAGEIHGELLMFWGRQDPHVPAPGRLTILNRLNESGTRLEWHEVNGAHAFMRDEGPRYDPALTSSCLGWSVSFLNRTLRS